MPERIRQRGELLRGNTVGAERPSDREQAVAPKPKSRLELEFSAMARRFCSDFD